MEYRAKEIHHFFYFHVPIVNVTRRNKGIPQFYQKDLFTRETERIFQTLLQVAFYLGIGFQFYQSFVQIDTQHFIGYDFSHLIIIPGGEIRVFIELCAIGT